MHRNGSRAQPPFLSTPSARRATLTQVQACRAVQISIHALREEGDTSTSASRTGPINFYPRPPRGGRPSRGLVICRTRAFLSTPSARRATAAALRQHSHVRHFYPRPPRGGRQAEEQAARLTLGISIHALREEGDGASPTGPPGAGDFYPRPPRGGRQAYNALKNNPFVFLSTPSARRATEMPTNS